MSYESPASILFDGYGNPVGVVQDGVIYRLQVESKRKTSITATRTSVNAATSDVLLLAANPARLNVIIYNDSNSPLYIGLGTTPVTFTNYTFFVSSQSNFHLPDDFIGEVHGAWQMGTGMALITELT